MLNFVSPAFVVWCEYYFHFVVLCWKWLRTVVAPHNSASAETSSSGSTLYIRTRAVIVVIKLSSKPIVALDAASKKLPAWFAVTTSKPEEVHGPLEVDMI